MLRVFPLVLAVGVFNLLVFSVYVSWFNVVVSLILLVVVGLFVVLE